MRSRSERETGGHAGIEAAIEGDEAYLVRCFVASERTGVKLAGDDFRGPGLTEPGLKGPEPWFFGAGSGPLDGGFQAGIGSGGDGGFGGWLPIEPGECGRNGGGCVNVIGEGGADSCGVVEDAVVIPDDMARIFIEGAGEGELLDDFAREPRIAGISDPRKSAAGPDVTVARVLGEPPFQQFGVALLGGADFPIELWREVIDPAFLQPAAGIGIKMFVCVQTANGFGKTGSPDAEWADTKADVRFNFVDARVEAFDEIVNVVAAPIVAFKFAAFFLVSIPGIIIGEVNRIAGAVAFLIWIKIIVEVNAVDVVAADHIQNHAGGVVFGGVFAGIKPFVVAVAFDQPGTGFGNVFRRDGRFARKDSGAIWIEPSMKLQASDMGFFDGKLERIVGWGRGLAELSAQIIRPRLKLGFVESVAGGADLENDGVEF